MWTKPDIQNLLLTETQNRAALVPMDGKWLLLQEGTFLYSDLIKGRWRAVTQGGVSIITFCLFQLNILTARSLPSLGPLLGTRGEPEESILALSSIDCFCHLALCGGCVLRLLGFPWACVFMKVGTATCPAHRSCYFSEVLWLASSPFWTGNEQNMLFSLSNPHQWLNTLVSFLIFSLLRSVPSLSHLSGKKVFFSLCSIYLISQRSLS